MTSQAIDFLGIGAQKAGTTWLWSILKTHPDVWMPPKKELHYFDRSPTYPSSSYLSSKYFIQRAIGQENYNQEFRKKFISSLLQSVCQKDWTLAAWNLRYYTGTYSNDWYLSLFKDGKGLLKGEITPSYSVLNISDIQQIKKLVPNLKIILILRNPIDRAWSQVRFDYMKNRIDSVQELEKIKAKIEHPAQSLRSDYVRIIDNWSSCFNHTQLFIGFFDDIISNPKKLVIDISQFLQLDTSKFEYANELTSPKNTSIKQEMPDEIEYYLAQKYYSTIEALVDRVGGYAPVWLQRAEHILKTVKPAFN